MSHAIQCLQEIADKSRVAETFTSRPETLEALKTIRHLAIQTIHAERDTDKRIPPGFDPKVIGP